MYNQYPYLNLNDLNLDYILKAIKEMRYEVTNFVSINAIKYADPIQWNITSQYEKNTIVIDPVTGTAYISVAPVPAGVALTRPEYWTVVFDLGSFVTRAAQNFTSRWESDTTLTATFPTNAGEWLVWGDVLYKALTNITAGDTYVVGSNIVHFTIEDLYNAYLNTVAQILAMVGDLDDLATDNKATIVNAINEVNSHADTNASNIGDLNDLPTSDKTSIVNSIDEVYTKFNDYEPYDNYKKRLHNEINAVEAGLVANDATVDTMTANTNLINNLLQSNKIVYIPDGEYYFNNTLIINKHCGIIGQSMRGTRLLFKNNDDGILVDIDVLGQHSEINDGVYYTFVLKNFAIYGSTYPNNTGSGLRFRNYTWEIDANFDIPTYISLKGDSYAAEFRNSPVENLYISSFAYGIKSGYFLAYGMFKNIFIAACTEWGIYNKFSDSTYSDITIVLSYCGLYDQCEENKFSNIAIKMCGYRHAYDATHPITYAMGMNMYDCKRHELTNIEIQECYANGAIFDHAREIMINGMLVDANGFDPNSGTSDIGCEFVNGCYQIMGDITATNKNPEQSQRMGMFITDDCHDLQIRYQETDQQSGIRDIVSKRIPASICTTFCDRTIPLTGTDFHPDQIAIARYDGHLISLDIHGYYNSTQLNGTMLFDFSGVFDTIPTGTYANNNFKFVPLYNSTDKSFYQCYINDFKLYCNEDISGGKGLHLNITYPAWLTYVS